MKKRVALLLAFALCLAAAGCALQSPAPQSSPTEAPTAQAPEEMALLCADSWQRGGGRHPYL